MTDTLEIATKADFARLCNVTPGRVSQWISEGKIPPNALVGEGRNAKINVAKAQARLKGELDPAMVRNHGTGGTKLDALASPNRIERDPLPAVADYRNRSDLPDDFARGVLFATHVLAYSMPTNAASLMMERGGHAEQALNVYRETRADISITAADPLIEIGLVPESSLDCGPYEPKLFCGFDPKSF